MIDTCELSPSYVRAISPYQGGKPISELARCMDVFPQAQLGLPGFIGELEEGDAASQLNLTMDQPKQPAEQPAFSARARIYRLTSGRRLILRFSNRQSLVFPLAVPRDPTGSRTREWSAWSRAEPNHGQEWVIRYRVML